MKTTWLYAVFAVASTLAWQAKAQIYDTNGDYVQTFAGSGFSGHVDGVGQLTMFDNPNAIVADSSGNVFVLDGNDYLIRKITPNGTVTTFAGGGNQSTGVGTNVNFELTMESPSSMTIDQNDTIWIAAYYAQMPYGCIQYQVTKGAVITYTNFSQIISPGGICADSLGNIYISDSYTRKIYRNSTNSVLVVFAGSGSLGYADGNGIFTAFYGPESLCADSANNIYVWDSGNYLIRKIDQNQNVTTFAGKYGTSIMTDGVGTNAAFHSISAMCFDGFGNLVLADNSCIRKISPTTNVVTMAGSFTQSGYANGIGNIALFNNAGSGGNAPVGNGVCMSQGVIYIADDGNQRIRNITFNPQPQVVSGANLDIGTFAGVTITGSVGRAYQVQSSPDNANWTTQATLLLTSSPYLWIDQNPVSGNKFYRAVMLP